MAAASCATLLLERSKASSCATIRTSSCVSLRWHTDSNCMGSPTKSKCRVELDCGGSPARFVKNTEPVETSATFDCGHGFRRLPWDEAVANIDEDDCWVRLDKNILDA